MKPEELRRENFIYFKGRVLKVSTIGEFGVQFISEYETINAKFGTGDLHPIPLDESWLKKFGFDDSHKKEHFHITVGEYEVYVVKNCFSGTLDKEPDWFVSIYPGYGNQPVTLVKMWVHEIQNLFYELGQELKLKQ